MQYDNKPLEDLATDATVVLSPVADDAVAATPFMPTIHRWSVAGYDRLLGTVFGAAGAKNIMTSPVLRVRLVGSARTPVAFTQSGNAYPLGEPAASLGAERAAHFIWFKSRAPATAAVAEAANLRTELHRLEDAVSAPFAPQPLDPAPAP